MKDFKPDKRAHGRKEYPIDGTFREPVVLCDACQELLLMADLHSSGKCIHCGNTRVRNVRVMGKEKQQQVLDWIEQGKVDQKWLDTFNVEVE